MKVAAHRLCAVKPDAVSSARSGRHHTAAPMMNNTATVKTQSKPRLMGTNIQAAPRNIMLDIIVRKATAEDLATLDRFQQGVVDAERRFDSTIKEGPVHYYDIPRMLMSDE